MTILLFRVATLTAIYLLVLTSVAPGDILVGIVLSLLLVAAGRRIRPLGPPIGVPMSGRLAGVPALIGGTLVDLAGSTWRTAVRCLSPRRTPAGAWGVRVGLTPDTVVVELDNEQGRMLLHVLDARDPDAVRAGQLESYERRQRRVFP